MAKGRKKKRYYRGGGSMDPEQLREEIDFVNGLEVPKPAEVKDERFELIELWGGEWAGPSAEAVLHEMLPIGDQMSLQLRDQILENDRLREENEKLYRLIPDELREAYLEWLTDGEDDESFSSYLGTHRSMNILDELAASLRHSGR